MSESINNSGDRKALLKHMILQLHEGIAPEDVRKQLVKLLSKIPYNEVVEVEQELIAEGLPETEVLRLCDVHTEALEGHIDLSGMKIAPPGHPVDTFKKENQELRKVVTKLQELFENAEELYRTVGAESYNNRVKGLFNSLMDVDKHYRRKENLLFPFLERYGITGPPKVMWGKHDETRDLLKNALRALDLPAATADQMKLKTDLHLRQAAKAISDMIMKEEEILLPMTLDKLTESDWYEIYRQTNEIGYCLYDPDVEWKPEGITPVQTGRAEGDAVKLPSGSFTVSELLALLNTMPVDITFVDKNDQVKYFSQGKERIFDRNRAIIGRDVRMCHPPSSVHVVEKILNDFKSGNETTAAFWIQMQGRFIHIEYFALRDPDGNYLGVLEVSQDLTEKRSLQGEQRILSYAKSTRH
jgi:PAS domain S-box-containing protein